MAGFLDWIGNRADITFNGTNSPKQRGNRQAIYDEERLKQLEEERRLQEQDALDNQAYYREQDRSTETANAIDVQRNSFIRSGTPPVPTERPKAYVDEQARTLTPAPRNVESRPILSVDEEDEVVDPTPSPLNYVVTGEAERAPVVDDPESGGLWKFFGYNTKQERDSASNGLLRAGGAMLGSNEGDFFRTLGKGVEGYAKSYGESMDDYSKRQLEQQKLRANENALNEDERVKGISARISKIYQDAGPTGLSAAQRQQVASLYAEAGDLKNAQAILGGNQTEKTADIREYEYAKQGGYTGSFADYQNRKSSNGSKKSTDLQVDLDRINEERAAKNLPAYTMEDYQQQQNRSASDTKFAEEAGKNNASMFKTMAEDGFNATSDLANIETLDAALQKTPGGLTNILVNSANQWGLGTLVSEGADSVQVANAMISKLTPMQRPPGSGAASDADMRLFRESLPGLAGTPEGNQIIVASMRGLATHKQNMGRIAASAQAGEITQSEALRQMRELPDPLAEFKRVSRPKQDSNAPLGPRAPAVTLPSGRSVVTRG